MSANATLRITGSDETAAAWAKVIGSARSAADQIQTLFTGAFAGLSIAGIANAVNQSLQLGEALKKAGAAAGVSGGTMSELAYVGKLAGVSMEDLSIGLKKMEQSVSLAATGSKEHALALQVLNLSAKDLLALSPDQMFERIGAAIAALPNPTDRARTAIDFFGRAGTRLIEIFSEGGDAIAKLREQARDLGLALTDETVDKLAEAEKQVKSLDTAFGNLWTTLVAKIAPALGDMATHLTVDLSDSKLAKLKQELADIERQPLAEGPAAFQQSRGRAQELRQQIAEEQARQNLQNFVLKPSDLSKVAGVAGSASAGSSDSRFAEIENAQKAAEEAAKELTDFDKEIEKANTDAMDHLAKLGAEQAKTDEKDAVSYADAWAKRRAAALEEQAKIDAATKKGSETLINGIEEFRGSVKTALDDFLIKGTFTFKKLGEYLIEAFAVKALNKEIDSVLDDLEKYLSKSGSGASGGTPGSGGGGFLSLISSAAGFFGFASGGSFDVGGSGGTDSQLVAFAATPGERVSVTPPGADSGGGISFNPTYHIDARGADAERIMAVMPSLMNQASEKAKRDVLDAFTRGGFPAPRTA